MEEEKLFYKGEISSLIYDFYFLQIGSFKNGLFDGFGSMYWPGTSVPQYLGISIYIHSSSFADFYTNLFIYTNIFLSHNMLYIYFISGHILCMYVFVYIGRFKDGLRNGRGIEFDQTGKKIYYGLDM